MSSHSNDEYSNGEYSNGEYDEIYDSLKGKLIDCKNQDELFGIFREFMSKFYDGSKNKLEEIFECLFRNHSIYPIIKNNLTDLVIIVCNEYEKPSSFNGFILGYCRGYSILDYKLWSCFFDHDIHNILDRQFIFNRIINLKFEDFVSLMINYNFNFESIKFPEFNHIYLRNEELCKFLMDHELPPSETVLEYAFVYQNIPLIEYCINHGITLSQQSFDVLLIGDYYLVNRDEKTKRIELAHKYFLDMKFSYRVFLNAFKENTEQLISVIKIGFHQPDIKEDNQNRYKKQVQILIDDLKMNDSEIVNVFCDAFG